MNKKIKSQELKKDSFFIGRAQNNDLAISDLRLSSTHCKLVK
jgi:hypothetical protein